MKLRRLRRAEEAMNWLRNVKLNWKFVAGWLAIGLAAGGLELWALLDSGTGDTLSELVWFGLGSHPLVWYVAGGGAIWLLAHFFFGRR
jgi:hypothetical protein